MMSLARYLILFLCCICTLATTPIFAHTDAAIDRVEPPFWWAGMQNPSLQLMVHGPQLGDLNVRVDYPGVKVERVTRVENPNYLFVDLLLDADVAPGKFELQFTKVNQILHRHTYELKARQGDSANRQGFDQSDVLYLITPDRFANGDPQNDQIVGMPDSLDRSKEYGRHGGDIQGIIDHLDYIRDLGFTAIWLNPVLENDMPKWSYHGYATTDYYKVDPRFGSNASYQLLSQKASEKGIKLIMDMIANHCGSEHWWMNDLPCSDWLNFQDNQPYVNTNHRKSSLLDPYVSKIDRQLMEDGWFVETMPDLNQRNELMSTYLIQNTIWWIEYAGLAGIRQDTYSYPHRDFMSDWTCRIIEEYPHFNIVGEEWTENPNIVAYWQANKQNQDGYSSCLPSLMDFPLQAAMKRALTEEETWGKGWIQLYESLANDFIYADPNELVVFPDNHDMSRIFTQVNEDYGLYQMALAFVCTTRGIPQLYYGTEILMSNKGSDSHGIIRSDFPGGWAGDTVNGFTGVGLGARQLEAQRFVGQLLNWRKQQPVIHHGKLLHFAPKNGVYVYFRYDDNNRIMVVLNKNEKAVEIDAKAYAQMTAGYSKGLDVIGGTSHSLTNPIQVPAKSPLILKLDL
ncbi:MAG: glycoside hydrolase family 13 protein [Bacteroidota bacterium]